MSPGLDKVTSFFSAALDILLLKYPTRTGVGIILGCVYSFLANIFRPVLSEFESIDVSAFHPLGWVAFGIITVNFPLLGSYFFSKPKYSEAIDEAIQLIDEGNFSDTEKRQHIRKLIDKTLQGVALNKETKKAMGETTWDM